jgi:hypothetical protein
MTVFQLHRCARRVRGLAAASMLSIAAFAGPSGAVSLNTQGFYTESMSNTSCFNATFCGVLFSPVPAGKSLIVQMVACRFQMASARLISTLSLVQGGRHTALVPGFSNVISSQKIFNINNPVVVPYVAGQRPEVRLFIDASSSMQLSCTLAGLLKP